jgi:hypothetical protein
MSGAPRSSAGTPLRKKRSPGPNITALVSTNCSSQLCAMADRGHHPVVHAGIRCEPISSTNTGSVSALRGGRIATRALFQLHHIGHRKFSGFIR